MGLGFNLGDCGGSGAVIIVSGEACAISVVLEYEGSILLGSSEALAVGMRALRNPIAIHNGIEFNYIIGFSTS